MLSVKINVEDPLKLNWGLKDFNCPECGGRDSFTSMMLSPRNCWKCGAPYPEITHMLKEVFSRINYYLSGHKRL